MSTNSRMAGSAGSRSLERMGGACIPIHDMCVVVASVYIVEIKDHVGGGAHQLARHV
jgi:hypothetical protein